MNFKSRIIAMITAIFISVGALVALTPPATAKADSYVTYLTPSSDRNLRVYNKDDCKGKSTVLSKKNTNAPWKVGSIYQKPNRVILWNFSWPTRTKKKGRCINVHIAAVALSVHYKKG